MNKKAVSNVDRLKSALSLPSVQEQFANALKDHKDLFVASLIDLYASDTYLQNCEPKHVIMEALKAATLKLPINKNLGFAYIVPYKKNGKQIPQFQLGYKGMIQLAMRSGVYKHINADVVFEGEFQGREKLTGDVDLTGEKTSDKIIGYFAYIETINGFRKTSFAFAEEVNSHAEKYSQSYSYKSAPWQTEFDSMAIKTMLRMLLGKYGLMTVDMANGFAMAATPKEQAELDYQSNANKETLQLPKSKDNASVKSNQQDLSFDEAEIEAAAGDDGPDF